MIGASTQDKAELAAKKAKKEQLKAAAKPVVPHAVKMAAAAAPTAQPIKGAGGQATKQVAAVRQDKEHGSKSGPEQQKKPLPKASLKQVIGGSKEQKAKKNKG